MSLQWLHDFWEWLKWSDYYPSEKKYLQECALRSRLSDVEFLATLYSSTTIRPDIPVRIREVLAENFPYFDKIVPSDDPADIVSDVDLQEFLEELSDEFEIPLFVEELPADDEPLAPSSDSSIRRSRIKSRSGLALTISQRDTIGPTNL
jgi:hypothetical protein